MTTHIAGFILRATDRKVTAEFYAALGLDILEHQHSGPFHYELAQHSHDFVVEVYAKSKGFPTDAIMLSVTSLEKSLGIALALGSVQLTDIHEGESGRFLYVTDPDMRPVMLLQRA